MSVRTAPVSSPPRRRVTPEAPADQEIRFCRASEGVRLAYATHGSGTPLVVVSCWLSHLQHDWQSPVWRHFLDELGAIATVVRYDERGFGMSDWNVDDFSLEARLGDLEAILDSVGFERFALLGMSGGSAVALAYAAKHPDRVTRLVLYGTVCGEPVVFDDDRLEVEETYRSLIRVGWAKDDPTFRRVFTTIFIPDATEEQLDWFDDLQRMSTPAVTATLANGRARLSAGAFNWDADLAPALGGGNLAPSPTAYLLGALAGCAVAFLHDTLAPQFGVTIDDVTAVARCSTDARGLLGIDGVAADLGDLRLEIQVSSTTDGAAIEAMLAAWRERCPIYLALLKPLPIQLSAGVGAAA